MKKISVGIVAAALTMSIPAFADTQNTVTVPNFKGDLFVGVSFQYMHGLDNLSNFGMKAIDNGETWPIGFEEKQENLV